MRPTVLGIDLDLETRCVHYRSKLDIIAIKMKCCRSYYACKDCHDALAGHAIEVWPQSEWNVPAVTCGVCGAELTVRQYFDCEYACPSCRAHFNPGCRNHYHFYFETNAQMGKLGEILEVPRSVESAERLFEKLSEGFREPRKVGFCTH